VIVVDMVDHEKVKKAVVSILEAIGEDPYREGLRETPDRVARMYEEIYSGVTKNPLEDMKLFHEASNQEMILVKDIPFYSVCEHHLLPFIGVAHVVYIPQKGQILGLSKIARIVDTISKRPQLQERLTSDIADTIVKAIVPLGAGVVVEAEHLCMTMRGIKKPGSRTLTSALRGSIKSDQRTRAEFLSLIHD
jgi:GTP cyclohydrolase I